MGNLLMRHSANTRTITLIFVGLSYLFIGAGVFSAIEREHEIKSGKELFAREKYFKELYNISDVDYDNMSHMIMELQPHKAGVQWSFVGALYFAITVVTTIGYGHAVPQTTMGKMTCIAYAVIGIPLCLVMFQAMGERMNNSAKSLLKTTGHKLGFKFDEVSHKCLIPFGILSCCVTVVVGSSVFSYFEGWSYTNSVYYCVMTLSTIGFGDYVAMQVDGALQQKPQYVAFSFVYILIGLTVIGAFLNLVILRMIVTLPVTPDGSTTGESPKQDDNVFSSDENSDQDFRGRELRRKLRRRRKKRSRHSLATSRSDWKRLLCFAKSRSLEEVEEESSIVQPEVTSSDDDPLPERRRRTFPAVTRLTRCTRCKCKVRKSNIINHHRSVDDVTDCQMTSSENKFTEAGTVGNGIREKENTAKGGSCNGGLRNGKEEMTESTESENPQNCVRRSLLLSAPNPRVRSMSDDSGYSGNQSTVWTETEKRHFRKQDGEDFNRGGNNIDSVNSVCGTLDDYRFAHQHNRLVPGKEPHYRLRSRATSPLFDLDRGSVVYYTKNEAVCSYVTIHDRNSKSSGDEKSTNEKSGDESYKKKMMSPDVMKPPLLRQKCVIAPTIVITPHSPMLSRTPNETSTETYASFLSDSDMEDRASSCCTEVTRAYDVTPASQLDTVASETELSPSDQPAPQSPPPNIEIEEQSDNNGHDNEQWFAMDSRMLKQTNESKVVEHRSGSVAKLNKRTIGNRKRLSSGCGKLFPRWRRRWSRLSRKNTKNSETPQKSNNANRPRPYDVTIRENLCHCECHRFSLPLMRKEIQESYNRKAAPRKTESLDIENSRLRGLTLSQVAMTSCSKASFDDFDSLSFTSSMTSLPAKVETRRNKRDINNAYCYVTGRDSCC
nr:uncharacterized protein LOC100184205 [Ciona intestinalis]|eukprot:XP_026695059.1 uncharacterized protein LOC100184205 [Ciona intestinalis]